MLKKIGNGKYEIELETLQVNQTVNRKKQVHFLFSLSALEMYELYSNKLLTIDVWDSKKALPGPSSKGGYQRKVSLRRYQSFANYISGDWPQDNTDGSGFCPTSVVLFLRNRKNLISDNRYVKIKLSEIAPLYIPDGQHRIMGMIWAIHRELYPNSGKKLDDPYPDIEKLSPDSNLYELASSLPVSSYQIACLLMTSEAETEEEQLFDEASQFFIINTENRRVPTSLAQQIILDSKQKISGNVIDQNSPIEPFNSHTYYLPLIVQLVIHLQNKNRRGFWSRKIVLPNEETDGRPITQVSFVSSLKKVVRDTISRMRLDVGGAADLIDAYWEGIRIMCPEATQFWYINRRQNEGKYYLLMTTTGVYTMHLLLDYLLRDVGRRDLSKLFNPEFWVNRFKNINSAGKEYFSSEFWRGSTDESGNKGECTIHGTSMSAFNQLATDIIRAYVSQFTSERS